MYFMLIRTNSCGYVGKSPTGIVSRVRHATHYDTEAEVIEAKSTLEKTLGWKLMIVPVTDEKRAQWVTGVGGETFALIHLRNKMFLRLSADDYDVVYVLDHNDATLFTTYGAALKACRLHDAGIATIRELNEQRRKEREGLVIKCGSKYVNHKDELVKRLHSDSYGLDDRKRAVTQLHRLRELHPGRKFRIVEEVRVRF